MIASSAILIGVEVVQHLEQGLDVVGTAAVGRPVGHDLADDHLHERDHAGPDARNDECPAERVLLRGQVPPETVGERDDRQAGHAVDEECGGHRPDLVVVVVGGDLGRRVGGAGTAVGEEQAHDPGRHERRARRDLPSPHHPASC
jgi:hypothetical protein